MAINVNDMTPEVETLVMTSFHDGHHKVLVTKGWRLN